jgi:hypothetical protein
MSSATSRASAASPFVSTWIVMPTSGTSHHGKPKKTLTNTSGLRASQVSARWTRSSHGEAPVHWRTVAVRIGTFNVTDAGR